MLYRILSLIILMIIGYNLNGYSQDKVKFITEKQYEIISKGRDSLRVHKEWKETSDSTTGELVGKWYFYKDVIPLWQLLGIGGAPATFDTTGMIVDTLYGGGTNAPHTIVFLSEGFASGDLSSFNSNSSSLSTNLLLQDFWKDYKPLFKIKRIYLPSPESGIDHPGTASDCALASPQVPVQSKNTWFNVTFDFGGTHRLVARTNSTSPTDYVNQTKVASGITNIKQVVLICNSPYYGGSGGTNACVTINSQSSEILYHELGHSWAGLKDEYGGSYCTSPGGWNATTLTDPLLVPWHLWLNPSSYPTTYPGDNAITEGIFNGCNYCNSGQYRPYYQSKMRLLNYPMGDYNVEAFIKKAYIGVITLVGSNTSTASTITSLPIWIKKYAISTVYAKWSLDGVYLDTTLVGHTFTPGNHTLTAVITDYNPIIIDFIPPTTTLTWIYNQSGSVNSLPSVNLTSPINGTSYVSGNNVNLSATATDSDGSIIDVKFYSNGILLNTDNSAPYSYTWLSVATGTYNITAKATDNLGGTTTSSISVITVNIPVNILPSCSLTSPINNATYTLPTSITLSATAVDLDGTITKVEFYVNNILTNTDLVSPYSYVYTPVLSATYSIYARATDNSGATTITSISNITVNPTLNTPPVVSLTSPINNSLITLGQTATISATASDDLAVTKVEFYAGSTLLNTDLISPYTYSWTSLVGGTYVITAKAYDGAGLVTTSSSVNLIVNTLPSVTLTSPIDGATQISPGSFTLTATATDNGSIVNVKFYAGSVLLNTDASSPYTYNWTGVTQGGYSITAVALDNNGGVTISSPVNITVTNVVNINPTVSITLPVTGNTFIEPATININVTASDADGTIALVKFYNGITLLSTDVSSPYSYSWTNIVAGDYTLTAVATDDDGAITSSIPITITVNSSSTLPVIVGDTSGTCGIKNLIVVPGYNTYRITYTGAVYPDVTIGWKVNSLCTGYKVYARRYAADGVTLETGWIDKTQRNGALLPPGLGYKYFALDIFDCYYDLRLDRIGCGSSTQSVFIRVKTIVHP